MKKIKVLAIQFKYLGDAVILTPALKALVQQIPDIELHVLVAADASPLLEDLPWITKVWAMPRRRGKVNLSVTFPFIQALRLEKFDRSIDFGGNDRGALLSFLSGAGVRLGAIDDNNSKLIRRIFYTELVVRNDISASYFDLHFELLSAWKVKRPEKLQLEIGIDPTNTIYYLQGKYLDSILCHISTSQPKKDWPLSHWQELFYLARTAGLRVVFSAGPNEREQKLLAKLKSSLPEAEVLPPAANLTSFLCEIRGAKVIISGDTGPLHFAEGLGVPVLGIFGVGNSIRQVAPLYSTNKIVCANKCACDGLLNNTDICQSPDSCMASIQPVVVFSRLKDMLQTLNTEG